MPRTLRDAKMDTRAARARLAIGRDYWRTLETGRLHLGYRRKSKAVAGLWLARRYQGSERYRIMALGLADDLPGAPGLSYGEAQKLALSHIWDGPAPPRVGGMTVRDAIEDYLNFLKAERATGLDAERRARIWILPRLGGRRIADLSKKEIEDWVRWMASQPAKLRGGGSKARPLDPEALRVRRTSANRVLTILKAALNRAFTSGLVKDDRARRKSGFKSVSAARPGFLTHDECIRLINACDPASGFRDLVHAALLTGARYGELCKVRVRDFAAVSCMSQKVKAASHGTSS